MLWSSSSAAVGRGTHLRNTAQPGVSVNVGHYAQSLAALFEEEDKRGGMRYIRHNKQSMGYFSYTPACHIWIWINIKKTPNCSHDIFPNHDMSGNPQMRMVEILMWNGTERTPPCHAVWWTTGGGWGRSCPLLRICFLVLPWYWEGLTQLNHLQPLLLSSASQ